MHDSSDRVIVPRLQTTQVGLMAEPRFQQTIKKESLFKRLREKLSALGEVW